MTKRAAIKTFRSTLFYAGAAALCVGPLFVFAWMIMTGLKTGVQNITYPPEFIFTPTLENFQAVFQQHNFLSTGAPEGLRRPKLRAKTLTKGSPPGFAGEHPG